MPKEIVFRNNPNMDLVCENYHALVMREEAMFFVPPLILRGIHNYKDHHLPVGDFLQAVLSNDLFSAMKFADPYSLYTLPFIVKLVQDTVPNKARGSVAAYESWINVAPELTLHTT